jgi:hypothetical protein
MAASGFLHPLPVGEERELRGLLTMENVQEFLTLRAADPTALPS